MRTPVLETKRLILRPLCEADAEEIYNNWASDPEVARFMTWNVHPNAEATREWLKTEEEHTEDDGVYDWGFERKSDHKLIGSGGIYYKEDRGMYNLGYNIMKDCWHQGYTSEAAAEIVRFAEQELNQSRLYAYHAKDNPNSGKIMEKIGFHYVKDTEYENMDGTSHFEAKEYLYESKSCKTR